MRGKRSKQYRKLMHHYERSFNFREPYQVLVDAEIIQDAARFSMGLAQSLERTLHAKIKPMITQCSIRHLYTAEGMDPAAKNACIETAKTFERRRCNHHTLPEPLSALECLKSVVDPKSGGTNKNRYVVASQDRKIRSEMRNIAGVPLIYINRSVMIMEPMASKTEEVRDAEERTKVRAGLKPRRGQDQDSAQPLKRKRSDEDDGATADERGQVDGESVPKKKKKGGPKGPNPLSVKKSKKTVEAEGGHEKQTAAKAVKQDPEVASKARGTDGDVTGLADIPSEEPAKKKRRRKHKSAADAPLEADGDVSANQALVAEA